jgi:DMSO/TMAO reductase YedYZ molybdopterin-dependent catalytic subunit
MPAIERYQTMECISNKVGGHIMSTGKFVGVPLPQILELAGGLQPAAIEVVFQSAGGYSDSMPVTQAMNPATLLVIGMNDHVLPRAHGFPVRVLGVGTYGMKNPKWLESIQAVDRPYTGFWEQRGWNHDAIIRTESRIDTPMGGAKVKGETVIAGVAIAGDRGISRVEVSADGGQTWNEAVLKTALSPLTWRLWMYDWNPSGPGSHTLAVRAYDGDGAVQTPSGEPPFPAGATGYDEVAVDVA